jgi:hypothetical protein
MTLGVGDAHCPFGGSQFSSITGITYACNGAPGVMGPAGAAGQSVVGFSLPPGDPHCPTGGSQFLAQNGITFACNGAQGFVGPVGPAGPSGPVGPVGPVGPQGPPGTSITPSAFKAVKSAVSNNVTGDGSSLAVIFDQDLFDLDSEYQSGLGTFTAKNAGVYMITCSVGLNGAHENTTGTLRLFSGFIGDLATDVENLRGTNDRVTLTTIEKLSVGQSVQCFVQVSGMPKTVGIAAGGVTFFAASRMF